MRLRAPQVAEIAGPPGGRRGRAAPGARPLQAAGRGRDHRLGRGPGRPRSGRPGRGHRRRHARHGRQVPGGPAAGPRPRASATSSARPSSVAPERRACAPERAAVAFGRVLREADLEVPVDSVLAFVRAWEAVGSDDRQPRLLGRPGHARPPARGHRASTTSPSPRSSAGDQRAGRPGRRPRRRSRCPRPPTTATATTPTDRTASGPTQVVRWSPGEVLRHKDFADCTDAERAEAMRLIGRAPRPTAPAGRPAAAGPTTRPGRWPDLRRTTRGALRTGGEADRPPLARPGRATPAPGPAGRRVRVHGGPRPGAAALRPGRGRRRHPGRGLRPRHPPHPGDPGAVVPGSRRRPAGGRARRSWTGRAAPASGACLREFNDEWGVRGLARGATVVVLSDGWDRGEPELLGAEVGPPAPGDPPADLGEPAEGQPRLRAAGPGHGRRPAPRRPVPRGPQRWPPSKTSRRCSERHEGSPRRPRPLAGGRQEGGHRPGRGRRGLRAPAAPGRRWR